MKIYDRCKLILCAIFGHKEQTGVLVGKKVCKKEPYEHEVMLQYLTEIEIVSCTRCWHTKIVDVFVE